MTLITPLAVRAEDEVRIELLKGVKQIEVRGDQLALYDGDQGTRIFTFSGQGTAHLTPAGSGEKRAIVGQRSLLALLSKKRVRRLLIEANHAVEVAGGLYYGRIEIRVSFKGVLQVYNRLPLETYLLGVLGSEMPSHWPLQALKAQAVASRTFALQRIMLARASDRAYDLKDTVISQVYRGAADISESVKRAVAETKGEVLVYEWELAEALFHSTCGGYTASSKSLFGGDRPYLRRRRCRWCRESPYRRWGTRISLEKVSELLASSGHKFESIREIYQVEGRIRIHHRHGVSYLSMKDFKRPLSWRTLPSGQFLVQTRRKDVVFEGRGFGHRVGMCQWGAKAQAEAGRDYISILNFYYEGAYVRKVY